MVRGDLDENPVNFAIMWFLYIIQKKNRYYTGITSDLQNRLRQHGNPPILYHEALDNKFQAAKREREIKGWSRRKKEELIAKFNRVSLPRGMK
jgi:putative endonuclease